MKCGIDRDIAQEMLALGWSKDEIRSTNEVLKRYFFEVHAAYRWGLLVKQCDTFLWYRGQSVEENCLNRVALNLETATVYADGSGTISSKPAGIGVYFEDGDRRGMVAKNIGHGTNNVAELVAIWEGLRQFPIVTKKLTIRSDSEYAIGSLTKDWVAQANQSLINSIRQDLALRGPNVTFEHVDGHAGIEGNEIADRLAKIGRKLVSKASTYFG